ncbi:MAG: transglutaminase family protein [Fimbriimonadaceae bacterium]|nr:transglutaminase family protein [Fimbriimonadaceae bacterium]
MTLEIEHRIQFKYSDFISESWMEFWIEPKSTRQQIVRSFFLAVGPPTKVHTFTDWLGNTVHHFGIPKYHKEIEVLARSIVETQPAACNLEDLPTEPLHTEGFTTEKDFLLFGGPIKDSPSLLKFSSKLKSKSGEPVGKIAEEIAHLIENEITYNPVVTQYNSTVEDALKHKAGVCQDIAQIMIGLLRLKGVPARYVNGYLHVFREGEVASESHAWVEFLTPTGEWMPYDPTNQCVPDERYVVVAHGRNYDDVPPNKGVYRGSATEVLTASVRTSITERMAVNELRNSFGSLDLPVFAKIPSRAPQMIDDQARTQTQQQQQ